MKPNVAVDVGNSRIKWGRCLEDRVSATVSLVPDEPAAWEEQVKAWELTNRQIWAVSGVHPQRLERFVSWVRQRGDLVILLNSWRRLPILVQLKEPDGVGIDRLLNAVAAKSRVQRRVSLYIVDVGSAVTVDWVDETGAFRGGAIFPGLRLMAKSLHEFTALLPLVPVPEESNPTVPGANTPAAIEAGIFWAVAGGIKALIRRLQEQSAGRRRHGKVFLTGGDAVLLAPVMDVDVLYWPEMTLEGIRVSAESPP